jgi:hypothetical protein
VRARLQGGRQRRGGPEGHYYYDGLLPYNEYLVSIDRYSLDNPLLQPTHENYRVVCNPNVVTEINLPLVLAAEIAGTVKRRVEEVEIGTGGIRLLLEDLENHEVRELVSFSNGEFFLLGVVPGQYRLYPDPEQMERLGYRARPQYLEFEVTPRDGGGTVDNLNFVLAPVD